MKVAGLAALYFLTLFAIGFALGTIRVLHLEPGMGLTRAELLETPLMIVAIYLVAKHLVSRFTPTPATALGAGLLALTFLLVTEFTFVLQIRGISFVDYYEERSLLSLSVYA